jgi:sec-independent protein translocase protein TatB
MEIFNIHIFEFLLIAGLALVVFGPERLPEVGRFIGQQVAKFLAWQQQSPELQMLNEVRGEFEREIASLRDELVRTRQQLDVTREMSQLKDDLRPMLDLKGNLQLPGAADAANGLKAPGAPPAAEPTIAPPDLPAPAQAAADLAAPDAPITVRPAAQTVPAAAHPGRLALVEPTTALGTPAPPVGDQQFAEPPAPPEAPALNGAAPLDAAGREQLLRRLQALAADLQALTAELRERGVIGADWQLPAHPPEQETLSR